MRGIHYCPLCEEKSKIEVQPDSLEHYTGNKTMLLGINEMVIPSLKKGEFYVFPTMLYHYIVNHRYQPPQEFLDSLESFSLETPFNFVEEEEKAQLVVEIPTEEVNEFNPSPDLIQDLLENRVVKEESIASQAEELFEDWEE